VKKEKREKLQHKLRQNCRANVSTTTLDRFRLLSLHVRTAIYKLIRYYDRYRFHLLSRRVCNLQLRNMFVAVGRQKECVTGAKYYSYV